MWLFLQESLPYPFYFHLTIPTTVQKIANAIANSKTKNVSLHLFISRFIGIPITNTIKGNIHIIA